MKRVLLLIAVLATAWQAATAYDFMVNGIAYNKQRDFPDSVLYVTYNCDTLPTPTAHSTYTGNINIPETVTYEGKDYKVTDIDKYAFQYCDGLTGITLPQTLWNISQRAFEGCSKLETIDIPDNVYTVGYSAFSGCTSLSRVVLGKSLYYIDVDAFKDCHNVNELVFNCSMFPSVKNGTFDNFNLTKVTIGENVEYIPAYFVNNQSKIKTLDLPNSVKYIGDYAFSGLIEVENITLPQLLNRIGAYAFSGCSNLKEVSFPEALENLGSYAYQNCASLQEVTITKNIKSIGDNVFDGCSGLHKVTYNALQVTSLSNSWLKNCPVTDVIIGNSVTAIPAYTFNNCSNLVNLTIGEAVSAIGKYAFSGCSSLKSLVIPKSVTAIGDYAFYGDTAITELEYNAINCANPSFNYSLGVSDSYLYWFADCKLTKLTIGNEVETIPIGLAIGQHCLKSIDIPMSVTKIGVKAFNGCDSISTLTIPENVSFVGSGAFAGMTALTEVYFNATNMNESTGYSENYWFDGSSLTKLEFGDKVINIPSHVAQNQTLLTSVKIPDSVQNIYHNAFGSCVGLTSITIPRNVRLISCSFIGCKNIKEIFYNAENCEGKIFDEQGSTVSSIIIGESVRSIPEYFACKFTNLTSIEFPDNTVTEIPYKAFYGCYDLRTLTMGNSVKKIGNEAFSRCSYLKHVTLSTSLVEIGEEAFYGCGYLTDLVIPDSVTTIGEFAFTNTQLTNLTIGRSVTDLQLGAFSGIARLKKIYCRPVVPPYLPKTHIGEAQFNSYIYPRATLYVPKNSLEAYSKANIWEHFENIEPLPNEPGDVNGDEKIDVDDINIIIDMILAGETETDADVNGDGKVDVADINAIIDMILAQ